MKHQERRTSPIRTTAAPCRVLAVPDKLLDTATAPEVAGAIAAGARAAGWSCTELPLGDGGEGALDALDDANRETVVTGELGEPVRAPWALRDGVAVVESARASGLLLAGGRERNDPVGATSRRTGELIAAALGAGPTRVVVTLGGSAMTDGGADAVEALEPYRLLGGPGVRTQVVVASDVTTTFTEAADVFGPQKGAGAEHVTALRGRLKVLARGSRDRFDVDVIAIPGSGSAGGLGGGLCVFGARPVPGFDPVAREAGLEQHLSHADLVVTGEGRLDPESFHGNVVGGVLGLTARAHVDTRILAGAVDPIESGVTETLAPGTDVIRLVETFDPDAAFASTVACLAEAVRRHLLELGGRDRP